MIEVVVYSIIHTIVYCKGTDKEGSGVAGDIRIPPACVKGELYAPLVHRIVACLREEWVCQNDCIGILINHAVCCVIKGKAPTLQLAGAAYQGYRGGEAYLNLRIPWDGVYSFELDQKPRVSLDDIGVYRGHKEGDH